MTTDIWTTALISQIDGSSPFEARSPLLDAKVMMVDDDPLMTDLVQTYLEEEGYTNFVFTNDSSAALEMLRREKPGVLLLDLMMPKVSGFELLEAMRRKHEFRYTPVIVLTASTGGDSKLRALKLGATDFLAKPVDASELVLRVRNTLAFQQYHNRMINFDLVTGLPNERLFERSVDGMLARSPPKEGLLALFIVAVPECRALRESIGRDAAEQLALTLSRRLERLAAQVAAQPAPGKSTDRNLCLARLNEGFGMVVDGFVDTEAVEAMARLVMAALSTPTMLGSHEVVPVPWIGIALAPGDGGDVAALRHSAELAAAHGRLRGTAQYAFASPDLNAKSYRRLTLGAQLRGAAQRGELRLHYQPKVDLKTGEIVGVEALVRWQHPDHGLMPPLSFIPLAEELGLMGGIGQWVLERACRDAAGWAAAGLGAVSVAVNVSKLQLMSGDLCSVVRQAMLDSGLAGPQLVIEFTESMLMDDVPACLALMHELKGLGVTLSIDDFGTGYSSLAYLKTFPLDELKIDRSFVIDLPGEPTDTAVVRTVIELGHRLGMRLTAEGVETEAQRDCLKQFGCDHYQGYLFSKPIPAEQFEALLQQWLATPRGSIADS